MPAAAKLTQPSNPSVPAPTRGASLPTPIENSGTINGPGAKARPARRADQPHTVCVQRRIESRSVAKLVEKSSSASVERANVRTRKRPCSTTGCGWRAERATKTVRRTMLPISEPRAEALLQPQSGASTRPSVSKATAAMSRSPPIRSGNGSSSGGGAGSRRLPKRNVATPMGRLIRKIQRQSTLSSRPPSTGPPAAERPPTADNKRTAPRRRSAGNAASRSPSEHGTMTAAPVAWTTRAAIRTPTPFAAAQSADPSVKTATPARKLRFRLVRSAQAAGGNEQRSKDDRVAVQHPRERREMRAVEAALQRGEGNVDDEEGRSSPASTQRRR